MQYTTPLIDATIQYICKPTMSNCYDYLEQQVAWYDKNNKQTWQVIGYAASEIQRATTCCHYYSKQGGDSHDSSNKQTCANLACTMYQRPNTLQPLTTSYDSANLSTQPGPSTYSAHLIVPVGYLSWYSSSLLIREDLNHII